MVIYFEGVSCAGKTSLIGALKKVYPKSVSLSELPDDYNKHKKLDDFCRYNDERKCQEAKRLSKKHSLVMVDRGYASTLVYNFIQFQKRLSDEYLKSIDWLINKIAVKELLRPDLYVFIKIDKITAINRAKQLNRFSKAIAWYTDPDLGNEFYESFFKIIEPSVPVLKLDGTKSTRSQVKTFKTFMKDNEK